MSKDSVFISYARADNVTPPDDHEVEGWVSYFWNQLRFELTYRGAKQAKLWLDRYEIEPQEAFTEEIRKALEEAPLIITILSNNWVQSKWCQRELDTFNEIHRDASERFIPIFKEKIERESLPNLMQGDFAREGYQFYETDTTGKIVEEFYWRGLQNKQAYLRLILRITMFILSKLNDIESEPKPLSTIQFDRTVFVAYVASDLRDARQRLINDLNAEGIQVVPNDETFPETKEALEKTMQDALAKSEFCIHLLGEKRGIVVEDTLEPIADYQIRMSRESSKPRIFCIAYQQNPAEFIKTRIGDLSEQEEIFGENITLLSQWLRKRLKPAPPPIENVQLSRPQHKIAVIPAHPDDHALATQLARNIQGFGMTVRRFLTGELLPIDFHPAVQLIPWGLASAKEIEQLIAQLPPAQRVICLLLPGGDETAKANFFHDQIQAQNVSLPASLQDGRKLLESLEMLPVNGKQT